MKIITGTIAYDYIMDFPGAFSDHILPDQIHKINLSFIVNKFARRRGGTAGNVSYSLNLLKTLHLLFSFAGKDFGEYKIAFEKFGIRLDGVKIDHKNYTSTGFAMTDKVNNQIWGYFYGASEMIPTLKLESVAAENDFVLIGPSGAKGSMSLINQCIKKNIPYMFDPGFILTQVNDIDLAKGVSHASYIIGNDYEINLIQHRIKNWDKILKSRVIIKTLGSKGSIVYDHGKKIKILPVEVKKPVDPTGAGDAWRAGFIAGLERNFDIKTSAQMGSVASAYAVETYGTQEHSYSLEEFNNRYRHTYKNLLDL